ncbi:MAG: signal peptidase I [Acidobacteria bacterium]|nr:MAG: signal peptidase I [Acidobacteriota bacterium]
MENGSGIGFAIAGIFYLVIFIVMIASMWKIYTKAGKPGWAAIIPIYNLIVLLEIVDKPLWWFILFLIPFVNFIVMILVCLELAKKFGKGAGFAIGLLLLGIIFFPILGFGSARYQG